MEDAIESMGFGIFQVIVATFCGLLWVRILIIIINIMQTGIHVLVHKINNMAGVVASAAKVSDFVRVLWMFSSQLQCIIHAN